MPTPIHIICGAGSAIASALSSLLSASEKNAVVVGFSREDFRSIPAASRADSQIWIKCDHSEQGITDASHQLHAYLNEDTYIRSISIFNVFSTMENFSLREH